MTKNCLSFLRSLSFLVIFCLVFYGAIDLVNSNNEEIVSTTTQIMRVVSNTTSGLGREVELQDREGGHRIVVKGFSADAIADASMETAEGVPNPNHEIRATYDTVRVAPRHKTSGPYFVRYRLRHWRQVFTYEIQ